MSRRLSALLVVFLVGLLLAVPVASRAVTTLLVNNGVACDDNTVDSSVTPYCNIQPAVDDALSGDTIQVAAGVYTSGFGVFEVDISAKSLTIDGAGEALTFIDANSARGGVRITNGTLVMSDLTVRNASGAGSGLGITVQEFDGNQAELDLIDVTLKDGAATYSAAGILVSNGTTADLLRVTVSGNDVNASLQVGAGPGGGMWIGGNTTVTITDSVFDSNTADTYGGAIAVGGGPSSLTITGTTFSNNQAVLRGGAIHDDVSTTTISISSSTFDTNTASTDHGGAIHFANGTSLQIEGSIFVDNTAAQDGGAINDFTASALSVVNSTFYSNEAGANGGAIRGGGLLNNITVSNNSADIGGGISFGISGAPTMRNSIVANNTDVQGAPDCYTVASDGYNLVESANACFAGGATTGDVTGQDPLLSAPADNGGPTETMAIASNSPARDAANPADPGSGGSACPATDQRGELRDDARCDIGAFELGPQVLRYSGANRYGTAAAVSAGDFPNAATVDTVFVATGTNFPDALSGAAVASKLGAPLLLVNAAGIPPETAAELTRLNPSTIVILGGIGAIPSSVETALGAYGTTVRLAGGNRYTTSVEVSKYGFPTDGTADVVVIASGLGFADALAGGPVAALLNGPVLLTDPNSLPQAVADEITRLAPSRIIVVGGTAVVSASVFTQLQGLSGDVDRIAGANRYTTSALISAEAFPAGGNRAYVATGLNFPDALAGAAAAGFLGAPVLLVPGTSLPAVISDEIARLGANTVIILGGTGVVSADVETSLETLLAV